MEIRYYGYDALNFNEEYLRIKFYTTIKKHSTKLNHIYITFHGCLNRCKDAKVMNRRDFEQERCDPRNTILMELFPEKGERFNKKAIAKELRWVDVIFHTPVSIFRRS